MISFHTVLSGLANPEAWNQLPLETVKQTNQENISKTAFACLNAGSTPTFRDVAEKTVEWIKMHTGEITDEDAASLDKLRVIFLRQLPPGDACVKQLEEVCQPVSFNSVTRLLRDRDKLLEKATRRTQEIDTLCKNLNNADWSAIKAAYEANLDDLPIDALRAFHDKKITMEQFCTLLLRWSLEKQFPDKEIHALSIFDAEGHVNPEAEAFIRQTLKQSGMQKNGPAFLTEEQYRNFIENMRLLPKSESTFFFIETKKSGDPAGVNSAMTITELINSQTDVNIFNQFQNEANGTTCRMIPTMSMMQQFLVVYKGEDAVKIAPVVGGLSSVEDIAHNIAMGTRDMLLPFVGFNPPKEADEIAAPYDIDFIFHDFYHCILASEVPHKFRLAFGDYARVVKQLIGEVNNEILKIFLKRYYERIIDMEHPHFRTINNPMPTANFPLDQKFLFSLLVQQKNAVDRIVAQMHRIRLRKAGETQTSMTASRDKEVISRLNDDLTDKLRVSLNALELNAKLIDRLKVDFFTTYGINPDDFSSIHFLQDFD